MIEKNLNKRQGESFFWTILIVIGVIVAAWFLTQKNDTISASSEKANYKIAKSILEPIFVDENSFSEYDKDDIGRKLKHYLEYMYVRILSVSSGKAEKHKEEITFYLKNNQLSEENLNSIKEFVYKGTSPKEFASKALSKEFFTENKNVYILHAYKKINSLLLSTSK